MNAAYYLSQQTNVVQACNSLAIPRASFYRAMSPIKNNTKHSVNTLALSPQERQEVLHYLHSERFIDRTPYEMYGTLIDEGVYLCSIRTMYRILEQAKEILERRRGHKNKSYQKPELLAKAPNQVWSWDITKLKTGVKWHYLHLYVIIDIYSRYVVGWMVEENESAQIAKQFIEETCIKQKIEPGQLTLHADRGASMKSKTVAQLLSDLNVMKTHNRPHVSNDNPFSEAQFKTVKYTPTFPERFGSIQDARVFCREFFQWYNDEHRHTSIALLTPKNVHYNQADEIIEKRNITLLKAFKKRPQRFKNKIPKHPELKNEVWINEPKKCQEKELN